MFVVLIFACLTFNCFSSSEIDESENPGGFFSRFLASLGCNPPHSYCCCCYKCVSEEEYLRQMSIEPTNPKPQAIDTKETQSRSALTQGSTSSDKYCDVHQVFVEPGNAMD